jgi:hypothetical protein
MAKIGSFGNRKKPEQTNDTIEYCGEELSLRPLDGYTLIEFTELMTKAQGIDVANIDPSDPEASSLGMVMLVSVRKMIEKALSPEDHERFVSLTREFLVDFPSLMEVATAIFAWASGRPTERQPGPSELPLTDGTSSNDTFSQLAKELAGPGTSENRATRRSTGRKAPKAAGL